MLPFKQMDLFVQIIATDYSVSFEFTRYLVLLILQCLFDILTEEQGLQSTVRDSVK